MYESISKNNELENEITLDMSYFWYSDGHITPSPSPKHDTTYTTVTSSTLLCTGTLLLPPKHVWLGH